MTGEFTMLKGIYVDESLVTQAKTDYFDSLDQIKVNNTQCSSEKLQSFLYEYGMNQVNIITR